MAATVMKDMDMVSVIVPAYNHEQYIVRCLDSILEDEYRPKEIVIINDGSSDGTDEKIQHWIEENGKNISTHYLSRKNRGLTKTLNEMLSLVNGRYIIPLASDDYLAAGGILARVKYLQHHNNKLAVFGDCYVVNENNQIVNNSGLFELFHGRRQYLLGGDDGVKREIVENWCVPGPVLMFDRKILHEIGVYNENRRVEDWDFYLRMVSRDLLGFIADKVSYYRIHSSSSSSAGRARVLLYIDLMKTAFLNAIQFRSSESWLLIRKTGVYIKLTLNEIFQLWMQRKIG